MTKKTRYNLLVNHEVCNTIITTHIFLLNKAEKPLYILRCKTTKLSYYMNAKKQGIRIKPGLSFAKKTCRCFCLCQIAIKFYRPLISILNYCFLSVLMHAAIFRSLMLSENLHGYSTLNTFCAMCASLDTLFTLA